MAKRKAKGAPSAGLTTVRTTFNPSVELEIDAAELLDLTRQGLVYHGTASAAPALAPGEGTDSDVTTDDAENERGAQ